MNIVLIGYRGTGKSEVGALLGRQLQMPCINMDANIVKRAGMSIPEIVEKFGWPKFRDLESDEARDLSTRDDIIIDTGGGIIERAENIEALGKNARIFWLKASVDVIVSRIQGDTQRPSLTDRSFTDEVAEVLARRTAKYRDAAHYEIETDAISPERVAEKVIGLWNR
jgi:shikimate kinase